MRQIQRRVTSKRIHYPIDRRTPSGRLLPF